ncbi:MAG TPA: TonB-dependent receptor plug domain-containing protein, partial [Oceanipulchritudo sp.]|nr:TonB-dependent receptor plug domain-containing protein [Oceanipulchritudo sp.]
SLNIVNKTLFQQSSLALLAVGLLASTANTAFSEQVFDLQPVTVTGDLLGNAPGRLPASVSVLRPGESGYSGNPHFENLAGRIPNLTWAGGTSRPRFFQIRGIGESSQFGNEIPASSVGFIIDGIDFTGIGSIAGLFDVAQIEVLRGPQAAAFGANALAGMIVVETVEPGQVAHGQLSASLGSHDMASFGAAAGGPIGSRQGSPLAYRISVNQYRDNGFRENTFLDRDDTNARDERSARLKLAWDPVEAFSVDLTLLYFDMDNGYDAWSLSNNSFHTTTDEPGEDDQETLAAGLRATWHITETVDISYLASLSDSDLLYSYDWDWSNPEELMNLYGPEVYWGTDVTERTRQVQSHDLRVGSPINAKPDSLVSAWVAGAYFRDFEEEQAYFGVLSQYQTRTAALYAQTRLALADSIGLTLAARIEDLEIDYADDGGTRLGGSEQPWGGKLAFEYAHSIDTLFYASVDRGFKAGGVNLDNDIPSQFRVYDTETLTNYELGWKGFFIDHTVRAQLVAFYMDRQDIQVDSSIQLGDGNTFALYKDNAASGHNYGLELELDWQASQQFSFHATLGLLEASFDDYRYIDPADGVTEIVLDGRGQAYAPAFTWSLGMDYAADNGFFLGLSLEGKDDYLFDVLNSQSLDAYSLLHLRAGFSTGPWRFTVWVNNALDEAYDTRGFYFANEPPFYDQPKKWVSQGAPRQAGLTVEWSY